MAHDWLKNYLRAYTAKAESCTFFGVPITEFDRDELLGVVVHAYEGMDRDHKSTAQFINAMTALRKAAGL